MSDTMEGILMFIAFIVFVIWAWKKMGRIADKRDKEINEKLAELGIEADYFLPNRSMAIDSKAKKIALFGRKGEIMVFTKKDIRGIRATSEWSNAFKSYRYYIEFRTNSFENPTVRIPFGTFDNMRDLWYERICVLFDLRAIN